MNIIESMQETLIRCYLWKNPQIKFQKLSKDATIPTYADNEAEGMDLYSPFDLIIPARGKINIKLGIKADIPRGYWLMFKSRSGTSWKAGIEHGAGVIDNNYKQELGLILYNHGDNDFEIKKGDRVAQAIPMRTNRLNIVEDLVEDGTRGGFGSTGR